MAARYDGGQVTINRSTQAPIVVEAFSLGVLACIQPEPLADKLRQGVAADGLYQRFMLYNLAPAGLVDYSARCEDFTEEERTQLFQKLHELQPLHVALAPEAQALMQDYHNRMRVLAQRTAGRRFAEHLDKFPGMLARVAFALHVVWAVATGGDPRRPVSADTTRKALRVMGVLYRHSEAVYAVLDRESGNVRGLVRSAAEAILSKGWGAFQRGDLTRNATHWQGADDRDAENAIDYLIELGWIKDTTPPQVTGRRGGGLRAASQ